MCLFVNARHVVAPVFTPTPLPARTNVTSRLYTLQREGAVPGSAEEEEEARHQENLCLHRLLHPVLLPLCDNKVTERPRTRTHRLLGASSHLAEDAFTIMAPCNKVKQCDVSRLSALLCNGFYLNCVCVHAYVCLLFARCKAPNVKGLKLSCHSCHARQAHSI